MPLLVHCRGELLLLDANPKDETVDSLTHQYVFVPKVVQICNKHKRKKLNITKVVQCRSAKPIQQNNTN